MSHINDMRITSENQNSETYPLVFFSTNNKTQLIPRSICVEETLCKYRRSLFRIVSALSQIRICLNTL